MKEKIIKAYINRLTKDDVVNYAKKNNINLNSLEVDYIYHTIKNNYDDMLNNPELYLKKAKDMLDPLAYAKIQELYSIYYPKLFHQ